MRLDKKPGLSGAGVTESQQQKVQGILNLSELSDASILVALHLIISALDGEKNYSSFCSAVAALNIQENSK